jgi:hypothetical protein
MNRLSSLKKRLNGPVHFGHSLLPKKPARHSVSQWLQDQVHSE